MDAETLLSEAGRVTVGLLGALSFQAIRPDKTWPKALITVAVGTAISAFVPPVVCDGMGWQSIHAANAATYGGGFVGYTAARIVLESLESFGPDWLRRWLGGKEKEQSKS